MRKRIKILIFKYSTSVYIYICGFIKNEKSKYQGIYIYWVLISRNLLVLSLKDVFFLRFFKEKVLKYVPSDRKEKAYESIVINKIFKKNNKTNI